MEIKRASARKTTKGSSLRLLSNIILMVVIVGVFLYELKNFQPKEGTHIESKKDYLPEPQLGKIYDKSFFSLSYVESYELPEWVAYRLTDQMLEGKKYKRIQDFEPDQTIKSGSSHYNDYKQTGYRRGHLVPAADMSWNEEAMNTTFLMSNVAPMMEDFNDGIWLELEKDVRDWARKYKNVVIITGPVFRDSLGMIGKNNVYVPRYFYKAVFTMIDDKPEVIGFIFDQQVNDGQTLDNNIVSIDSIEKLIGIDLFANMYGSWEAEIEKEKQAMKSKGMWTFNREYYNERIEN